MRDEQLLSLRPEIDVTINGAKNEVESFMHETLRPILKFQHGVILSVISNSEHFEKLKLQSFPLEERREKLKDFVSKNSSLKNQLIGITLGLFTESEIIVYQKNSSELNKRILDMCVTRFDSASL